MDKYVWYAIIETKDGKHYAHAFRLCMNQNLASFIKGHPDITAMNACPSMKYAKEIVQVWNESFAMQGTHMFGEEKQW